MGGKNFSYEFSAKSGVAAQVGEGTLEATVPPDQEQALSQTREKFETKFHLIRSQPGTGLGHEFTLFSIYSISTKFSNFTHLRFH